MHLVNMCGSAFQYHSRVAATREGEQPPAAANWFHSSGDWLVQAPHSLSVLLDLCRSRVRYFLMALNLDPVHGWGQWSSPAADVGLGPLLVVFRPRVDAYGSGIACCRSRHYSHSIMSYSKPPTGRALAPPMRDARSILRHIGWTAAQQALVLPPNAVAFCP